MAQAPLSRFCWQPGVDTALSCMRDVYVQRKHNSCLHTTAVSPQHTPSTALPQKPCPLSAPGRKSKSGEGKGKGQITSMRVVTRATMRERKKPTHPTPPPRVRGLYPSTYSHHIIPTRQPDPAVSTLIPSNPTLACPAAQPLIPLLLTGPDHDSCDHHHEHSRVFRISRSLVSVPINH